LARVAVQQGVDVPPWGEVSFDVLAEEAELDLIRKLSEFPEVVQQSAALLAPHRLTRYAEEVAAGFHHFYAECRVISEDAAETQARLWLATAAKLVIGSAL